MNKWVMIGVVIVVGYFLWSKFGGKLKSAIGGA